MQSCDIFNDVRLSMTGNIQFVHLDYRLMGSYRIHIRFISTKAVKVNVLLTR